MVYSNSSIPYFVFCSFHVLYNICIHHVVLCNTGIGGKARAISDMLSKNRNNYRQMSVINTLTNQQVTSERRFESRDFVLTARAGLLTVGVHLLITLHPVILRVL